MDLVQQIMPRNANKFEESARIHGAFVREVGVLYADHIAARDAVQQALALRPTSGYAWANLAAAEYALLPPATLS